MSSKEFKTLQASHEDLLRRQLKLSEENKQEFIVDAQDYIAQSKKAGASIHLIEEREQLRANLRYWASYIYGVNGQLPDIELVPSVSRTKFYVFTSGRLVLFFLFAMLIGGVVFTIIAVRKGITSIGSLPPLSYEQWTAIAKTQEVMAQPESEKIKFWLNSNEQSAALEQELIGNYDVADVSFLNDNTVGILLDA